LRRRPRVDVRLEARKRATTKSNDSRYTTEQDRLMSRVEKDSKTGCWNWTGYTLPEDQGGYGQIMTNNGLALVHRFSYELHRDLIPVNQDVHIWRTCENKVCVNPDHLELREGVTTPVRGSDHWKAKVTEDDVRDIRRKREAGWSYPELKEHYGMSVSTLWRICNRTTWTHVA